MQELNLQYKKKKKLQPLEEHKSLLHWDQSASGGELAAGRGTVAPPKLCFHDSFSLNGIVILTNCNCCLLVFSILDVILIKSGPETSGGLCINGYIHVQ